MVNVLLLRKVYLCIYLDKYFLCTYSPPSFSSKKVHWSFVLNITAYVCWKWSSCEIDVRGTTYVLKQNGHQGKEKDWRKENWRHTQVRSLRGLNHCLLKDAGVSF